MITAKAQRTMTERTVQAIFRTLIGAVLTVMLVVFAYGVVVYTYGPIKPCDTPQAYCDKLQRPHTAEEYEAFIGWQGLLFLTWLFGMPTLYLLQKLKAEKPDEERAQDQSDQP